MEKLSKWPVLSVAGVLVIVFYCTFTFMSILLLPGPFSPVNNWLSDLGNSSYSPRGAAFHNVGCVLTGLALFPFFTGFYKWYTDEKWRKSLMMITQSVGFIAAFALIMIGVFSEDYGAAHVFWSQVFFILNLMVLMLANVSLMTHRKLMRPVGYYGFAVAAVNLLFVALSNTPLLEWFTVFTALAYVALLAYNTFKTSSPS